MSNQRSHPLSLFFSGARHHGTSFSQGDIKVRRENKDMKLGQGGNFRF
jgi:hypothetical protein